jgi:pimeloyl-ACP methyl ester carboxylesterase
MGMRFHSTIFVLLFFAWMLLSPGCGYMVKNEKHEVYSKSKYGQDRFVVIQNRNIHYVESGEGHPVLLIPGAWSTYRYWNRIIPLVSRHYRLLALDYLGAGDSDKPGSGFRYTVEEQADLVEGVIESLQVSKVHIIGTSYGGSIALNLAARYPDRVGKIVSIEGNGMKHKKVPYRPVGSLLKWPVFGEVSISVTRSGLLDRMIAKGLMGKAWHPLGDHEREEIVEIISQTNKTASRIPWYRISRTLVTSKDFAEETKAIRIPVLYLYGEHSGYRRMAEANAEFLKAHLSQAEVFCVKDGIHNLELQKPEEVANLILEFFSKDSLDSLANSSTRSCQ